MNQSIDREKGVRFALSNGQVLEASFLDSTYPTVIRVQRIQLADGDTVHNVGSQ